jgi:hypothetical protein
MRSIAQRISQFDELIHGQLDTIIKMRAHPISMYFLTSRVKMRPNRVNTASAAVV